MSVSSASIHAAIHVPVQKWPHGTSFTQGASFVKDFRSSDQFLFVSQAVPSGRGDVEDSLFHRHQIKGNTAIYLDTMTGKNFGHPQNYHVVYSLAGNIWIWGSLEQYGAHNQTIGLQVARFRYHPGATLYPDDTIHVPTGGHNAGAIATNHENKIVLRRGLASTEVYEECNEQDLLDGNYRPVRSLTRAKKGPGNYQSACSSGDSVFVVNGTTDKPMRVYQHTFGHSGQVGVRDVGRNVLAPTGPNTSHEPESLCMINGKLHLGKRFNHAGPRRQYIMFAMTW